MLSGTTIDQTREVGDVDYVVQSDIEETASVVMNTVVSRSTAEGEVPQQMCIMESQGGGSRGETSIQSERTVTVQATISGADATAGMIGM